MLKRIPKSDISIRPFKAYKEWAFDESSSEISVYEADSSTDSLSNLFPKNSIYGQLRAQFYNGHEDNPFLRFGDKTNYYTDKPKVKERFLSGSAKVISIPQIYVGEGIKKGSFELVDNSIRYFDDSYGNLIGDVSDRIYFGKIDVENGVINFLDSADNPYSGNIDSYFLDIENNEFILTYSGDEYTLNIESFDLESGIMLVTDIPFLLPEAQVVRFGNVFYSQGLIVLTRESNSLLSGSWDISYKSTNTIYEHEYLLVVEQDEFNVSTNPSSYVHVGLETEYFTDSDGKVRKIITKPGVKYIRKKSVLENGEILDFRYGSKVNTSVSGGFEHYFESGSVDSTGSFLAPYITTIGLYDDDFNLVAVAKLPQPIKSEHDIPVNFIVRFDT